MDTTATLSGVVSGDRTHILKQLERKLLWLSSWMIHNANHIRPNRDGLKVGGHQASCASVISIMAALYFEIARPQDRIAVKPHAGPVFHAINYLFGRQTLEKMQGLRQLGGVQSYPSRVKDGPEVDFSTGSVGLGVAMTTFAALMADYVRLHGLGRTDLPPGPPHRHRRRRGTRRGQHLRGVARGLEARRPQSLVDHRLQPPEPRFRGARPAVRPHRGPVPRHGLERRHHQIRPQAGSRLRARGRRGVARLDRRLPELAVFRADLPGRGVLAPGAAGRPGAIQGPRHHRHARPTTTSAR